MEILVCIGWMAVTAACGYIWGRSQPSGIVAYAHVDEGKRGRWRWYGYDASGQRRSSGFPDSFPTKEIAVDEVKHVHPGIKVVVLSLLLATILGSSELRAQGYLDGLKDLGRAVAGDLVDQGSEAARERLGLPEDEEPAPGAAELVRVPPGMPSVASRDWSSWMIPLAAFLIGIAVMFAIIKRKDGDETRIPPLVRQIASEGFPVVILMASFLMAGHFAQGYEHLEGLAAAARRDELVGVLNQRHIWAAAIANVNLTFLLFAGQDRVVGRGVLHSEAVSNKALPGREKIFTVLPASVRAGILRADAVKLAAIAFIVASGMGF